MSSDVMVLTDVCDNSVHRSLEMLSATDLRSFSWPKRRDTMLVVGGSPGLRGSSSLDGSCVILDKKR